MQATTYGASGDDTASAGDDIASAGDGAASAGDDATSAGGGDATSAGGDAASAGGVMQHRSADDKRCVVVVLTRCAREEGGDGGREARNC